MSHKVSGSPTKKWFTSHFSTGIDKVAATIVIIILAGAGLMGIFRSSWVGEYSGAIICFILPILTLSIYEIWHQTRKISRNSTDLKRYVEKLDPGRSHNVSHDQISGALGDMLKSSGSWMFRGGSGRWQREAVLPRLAEEREQKVHYKMLILDPTSSDLCEQYANYRNKHRKDTSTDKSVRNDLLACIVACCWYAQKTRIDPSIFVSQIYSPLRQDISDNTAAITVADPNKDGLFIPRDSWYYKPLVDEFDQLCARSKRIKFFGTKNLTNNWRKITDTDVQSALESAFVVEGTDRVSLENILDLSQKDLSDIRTLVFKGRK